MALASSKRVFGTALGLAALVPRPATPSAGWHETRWHFSSTENCATFVADPDEYAPRYGGFCAGGVSLSRMAPIDPEAWVIVDAKLFLGNSSGVIEYIIGGAEERIAEVDANWAQIG